VSTVSLLNNIPQPNSLLTGQVSPEPNSAKKHDSEGRSTADSSIKVTLSSIQGVAVVSEPSIYTRESITEQVGIKSDSNTGQAGIAVSSEEELSVTNGVEAKADNTEPEELSETSVGSQVKEGSGPNLSEQEKNQVEELRLRDAEVRAHEQAHKSAGGQYAGAISLSYQSGPDGKRYAVGGEVPIDVSPVAGDPRATIAKMNTVRAAATAPADPSAQDRSVAAAASSAISKAQTELAEVLKDESENEVSRSEISSAKTGVIEDQQQSPSHSRKIESYDQISNFSERNTHQLDLVV